MIRLNHRLILCCVVLAHWTLGELPSSLPQEEDTLERGIAVKEMPSTVVALKRQPLNVNCSLVAEKGYEPRHYHWKKDGKLIKSREHSRVRVLPNGTLHFKQVIHRERGKKVKSDEGFYECFVRNRVGTVISRRVSIMVARISKTFSQEPSSKKARIGSTILFQCSIHAVTEPHYAWEKDRQPISTDDSKYVLHQSGMLQINNVQPSDAGSYKCIAANKALFGIDGAAVPFRWRNGKEVSLDIAEDRIPEPYLKVLGAPANESTARVGDMTTLECIVDGYPTPVVTWTKDGETVNMKGRKDVKMLRGGSLRLSKVRSEHQGEYRCLAKLKNSDELYEMTTHLKVIAEPVIEIGPHSAVHPVAKVIFLLCKVTGQPQPEVTWVKDGEEILSGGHFRVQVKDDTSNLVIYGVEDSDSGYYQCLAENEAGSTSSIARMKIELKANAPNRPEKVKVKVMSSSEVEVTWHVQKSNDIEPIISYTVHWISYSGEEKVNLTKSNRTIICSLKANTNYTVYVKAYTKSGASLSSEKVTFTTLETVPKGYPHPTLESQGSRSIVVEWEPLSPDSSRGVVTDYRLFYKPAETDIGMINVDGNTFKYTITDLLPDTEYSIRMLAATKHGFPNFTDDEWPWIKHRTLKTSNTQDHVTPKVTIDVINTTTVKVTWQFKQKVEMTKQVIYLRNLQQSSSMNMYNMDGSMREVYFHHLAPDTMYEFYILGQQGSRETGMVTKIFSTMSNATRAPSNLSGHCLRPDAIAVKWRYTGEVSPSITHYRIRYKPNDSDTSCSQIPEKTLVTHSQEVVLTSLQPFTYYSISVGAVFEDGDSMYSPPLVLRTLEDIPSPPENVEAVVLAPGRVKLQWKPPHHPNGNINGHVISYNMEVIEQWTEQYQEGPDTAALVQNLTATTYIFRVQACNGAGKSQPSSKLIVHLDHLEARASGLTDQQLGILGGAAIGLTSILITIVVVYCKQRQFYKRHKKAESTAGSSCACKRDTNQSQCDSAVVAMDARSTDPQNKMNDRKVNTADGATYKDDQAEELLALLATREWVSSTTGDTQSASTDNSKEDMSDETATTDDVTVQLTSDTTC